MEQPYIAYIRTNEMLDATDIALQFKTETLTMTVDRDDSQLKKFEFPLGGKSMSSNESDLTMTIHREGKCLTKTLTIGRRKKNNFVFIQTDKAIYKPGDDLQFRIVIINRVLRPVHFTDLDIQFINPKDIIINPYFNLINRTIGYFEGKFKLDSETELGEWQIKATLNKKIISIKKFEVRKYKLPLYDLYIVAPKKFAITDKKLKIEIKALYSFGEFVPGTAYFEFRYKGLVKISRQLSYTSSYWIIDLDTKTDLKINQLDDNPSTYQLYVQFEDEHKVGTLNKTVDIALYSQRNCVIKLKHFPPIQDERSYSFDVIIEDFDGNVQLSGETPVIATITQNQDYILTETSPINNGIASFTFKNLKENGNKKISINFGKNCKMENLELQKSLKDILHVTHEPLK